MYLCVCVCVCVCVSVCVCICVCGVRVCVLYACLALLNLYACLSLLNSVGSVLVFDQNHWYISHSLFGNFYFFMIFNDVFVLSWNHILSDCLFFFYLNTVLYRQ